MRASRPSSTRRSARLALPVAALVGLTGLVALTTAAAAPPLTANCDTTVGDPSISSFLTHEEVERRLAQIERTSKGTVDVDVAGQTQDGLEIYTARVGTGASVVLIESHVQLGLLGIGHDDATGDVVVCEGTSSGRHRDGPWRAGVPEWGAGRFCDVFEVRDWLISRCFIYVDPDDAGQDTARYAWLSAGSPG